jgi:hypothetical protein
MDRKLKPLRERTQNASREGPCFLFATLSGYKRITHCLNVAIRCVPVRNRIAITRFHYVKERARQCLVTFGLLR